MVGILKNSKQIKVYFAFLLFLFFPLRESFAFSPANQTFIRFGDLLISASIIIYLLCPKQLKSKAPVSNALLIFMLYALVFGVFFASIFEMSYAIKFLLKGFGTVFFLRILEKVNIKVGPLFFDKLFFYTICITVVLCALQLLGYTIEGLKFLPYTATLYGLPRLNGTASEPGFLVPLIAPCYAYYLYKYKEHPFLLAISVLILLFTNSSFGYVAIAFVLVAMFFQMKGKAKLKYASKGIPIFCIALVGCLFLFPKLTNTIEMSAKKILAFGSSSTADMDWSAAERFENRLAGFRGYYELPLENKIMGGGLGTAQHFSEKYVVAHFTSEECGIAYLGVLLNLGIVGIVLLIFLFYRMRKYSDNNVVSKDLFLSIVIQAVQFFIIAGMWIYLFWFDIGLLILAYKNRANLAGEQTLKLHYKGSQLLENNDD